jgi:L-seryl-tRNA(Ser) seleniumtransferase
MDMRDLPSTDALAGELAGEYPWLPAPVVVAACRSAIADARLHLAAGTDADPSAAARETLAGIEATRPRRVINATGVLLHTNLGRAPLHHAAAAAMAGLAESSGNIEVDIRTGRRSQRNDYLGRLLPPLTGAESGFAVNNNAGALLLALASVAGDGGRVAVSRGELIEIGGSFRLPELMRSSGARLVEVGTTNRTRIDDFAAVVESVDAILKVHPSNYRIDGFSEEASAHDLARLASRAGVPFIYDVGSGLLDATTPWIPSGPPDWIAGEPGVVQAIGTGADLVLFSGDKLLGGPQAGVIVGTAAAVRRAEVHPMARALRLDGGTIAALATTLQLYLDQQVLAIPFWRMATTPADDVAARAGVVAGGLEGVSVEAVESVPGAGSVPGRTIPSFAVCIHADPDRTWARLASSDDWPVIGTRRDGATWLDLRSVAPEDDARVRFTLERALT